MLERDLKLYFKTAGEPSQEALADITASVQSGLKLEQGLRRKATREVVDAMVREIALSTYYAADFLHIPPWPNFGLTYEWGKKPPKKQRKHRRVILANATVGIDNPYGRIGFSPLYLGAIADFLMGRNYDRALNWGNGEPLAKITAHENYHVWQYFVYPKTMEKETEVLSSSGGLRAWEKTRAERTARGFEDIFEGARNSPYSREDLWDPKSRTYL